MSKFERPDLEEFVRMYIPAQATSLAALDDASRFAASHFDEIQEDAKQECGIALTYGQRDFHAQFLLNRLIELRNAWLRGHGSFNAAG